MGGDAMIVVNSVIGGLLLGIVGFAAAWLRARERAIRAELSRGRPAAEATAQQLDRLQQAVDAIAVEVERISEGQRFTAKLLADRGAAPVERSRLPGQSITPH